MSAIELQQRLNKSLVSSSQSLGWNGVLVQQYQSNTITYGRLRQRVSIESLQQQFAAMGATAEVQREMGDPDRVYATARTLDTTTTTTFEQFVTVVVLLAMTLLLLVTVNPLMHCRNFKLTQLFN
jgi:hypothetical protein